MKLRNLSAILVAMLACAVSVGCGGKKTPEGFPKLSPCSVKIVQDGAPLEGASVSLISDNADLMRFPTGGVTGSDGVAIMTTYGFTGAPDGTFKVTVTKEEVTGGAQSKEDAMKAMTGEIKLDAEQHFSLVADQFGSSSTTPLTITLPSADVQEFDVGEAVRIERKMPGM